MCVSAYISFFIGVPCCYFLCHLRNNHEMLYAVQGLAFKSAIFYVKTHGKRKIHLSSTVHADDHAELRNFISFENYKKL
jgi:hypothetical protein